MPDHKIGIYKYEPLWGEWYVDELIGKGSYGEVYKIHRTVNGKQEYAAAKYISIPKDEDKKKFRRYTKDELTTLFSDRADKFYIEISSMMKLKDSKNVVRYEEHIKTKKEDDVGWDIIIRMELLTSLEDYLDEHPFKKQDAIKLGIDICSAIASCQDNNIIHRDIKIENIFMDALGNFKLGDFGVSREGKGTATGTITGTEDYMAPEISTEHKYNSTVDIYALGIAMYQLLNNRRNPFINADTVPNADDESRASLSRMNGEEMPPPKYGDKRLTPIILKACAFDRHSRYASPAEMADELKKLLDPTDDTEVLSKKEPFDFGGETQTDIPSDNDGTVADNPNGRGGTISELDPPVVKKKKSKKLRIISSIAIAICAIVVAVYIFIPKEIPITNIDGLPDETVQMVVEDKFTIKPMVYPIDTTSEITYESQDPTVAKVDDNGVVTALKAGGTIITVRGDNIVKELSFNITDKKIPVTDITGIGTESELIVGSAMTLNCKVVPDNATEQNVTYSSSNLAVADIGSDGVITAISPGETNITATSDGISKTMKLTVKAQQVQQQTTQSKPSSNNTNTNSRPSSNGGNGGSSGSSYVQPRNDPPAVHNEPAPAPQKNNSTSQSDGSSDSGKQYEAGDLSAFQ